MCVVEITRSGIAANKAHVSVQDWLLHPQVQLAAYLPFFKEAGAHELQVSQLNCLAFGITLPLPRTSPQCKNAFLLSPGISDFTVPV